MKEGAAQAPVSSGFFGQGGVEQRKKIFTKDPGNQAKAGIEAVGGDGPFDGTKAKPRRVRMGGWAGRHRIGTPLVVVGPDTEIISGCVGRQGKGNLMPLVSTPIESTKIGREVSAGGEPAG